MSFFDLFSTKKKDRSQRGISQDERLVAKAMIEAGEPLFEISHRRIDPDENIQTPKGAEISYLDARALEFWDGKRTDFKIPTYYSESAFGRNVGPALQRLTEGGYLNLSGIDKSIALKTVPELRAILAEHGLKMSGKKTELIYRLVSNLSEQELDILFPVSVYEITPKGEHALETYSIIFLSERLGAGLPYYRLLKEKETSPMEDDVTIILRLLTQDMSTAQKGGNRESYRTRAMETARILNSLGQSEKAMQYYCVSFFMLWYRNTFDLKVSNTFAYEYDAKRIDECGKICGYSFEQTIKIFRTSLQTRNPFNLCTKRNISAAEKVLKDALSV